MQDSTVTTPPSIFQGISKKYVDQMGFTPQQVKMIQQVYVDTLEDYRPYPMEKVSVSWGRPMKFKRIDGTWFSAKKDVRYLITLKEVVQLLQDPQMQNILTIYNEVLHNYRRYEGQNADRKIILTWMDGGIGDTLFYQCIFRAIKRRYPTCQLIAAGAGWFGDTISRWGLFDRVLTIPFPTKTYLKADYHLNFDGAIVRVREAERTNVYEHLAKWVKMDIQPEECVPSQPVDFQCLKKAKNRLRKWGHIDDFIIVNTSSRSKVRSISDTETIKLWNALTAKGYNLAFLDFRNKANHYDALIAQAERKDQLFNYCRDIRSISDSVALISLAKMMVSVDTANNHIAASVGVPIFGLFGPFEGYLRLPTYPNTTWIDRTCELGSCHSHAVNDAPCPNPAEDGFPKCYTDVDWEEIADKVEKHYQECQKKL